jgi:hypothetical protein
VERNQAGAINMKTLLQELFEISCVIVGLYVGYLLIKHIWLVFDISPTGTLFFILALFTYYVWLSRNYKYGLYRLLKDIHQSNLDDIEQQQLEEPVDEVVVKEQISNSVAAVNIFWFTLWIAMCCVTFLIGQESIGVVDWLIVLSIIAAPLILAYFVGEWFIDTDETKEKEAEVIQ